MTASATKTKSQKKVTIQTLKENNGVVTCDIDLTLLEGDWLIKMETLKALKAAMFTGSYFNFTDDVQEFIDVHQVQYDAVIHSQSAAFSLFRRELLSVVVGPLYEYVQRVQEIVLAIYRFKKILDGVKISKAPKLICAMKHQSDSDKQALTLYDMNELEGLDKLMLGHFFRCWLHSLNTQEAARRKEFGRKYYELSKQIRSYIYQEDGTYWKGFKGNDYVLNGLMLDAMSKMNDEGKIYQLMYVVDAATREE